MRGDSAKLWALWENMTSTAGQRLDWIWEIGGIGFVPWATMGG